MILSIENAKFLEELYNKYLTNNNELSHEWKEYFKTLESENGSDNNLNKSDNVHKVLNKETLIKNTLVATPLVATSLVATPLVATSLVATPLVATSLVATPLVATSLIANPLNLEEQKKILAVNELINTYRSYGFEIANLDPLGLKNNDELIKSKFNLSNFGLNQNDIESNFVTNIEGLKYAKLKSILSKLTNCYTNKIGADYGFINSNEEKEWLNKQIESEDYFKELDKNIKLNIFKKIYEAESFEKFLSQKFIGKKRFSLEGSETFIALLDTAIEIAAIQNVDTIVLGMAHRGRLNVLVNVLNKPASFIFAEFNEKFAQEPYDYADVKYHLGFSYDYTSRSNKKIHLSLAFNPSHLEAVYPVVIGNIRARQTKNKDLEGKKYIPIIVHGDASFMGQGVVSETLNLYKLNGYKVGGAMHFLINNQIGFTTFPEDSRSTTNATDLAKAYQIPILHVNGDDPEAAFRVTKLAMEYRDKFSKDIIIDLVTYRRLGHNETDEPSFTQPQMYAKIKALPTTFQLYKNKLLSNADATTQELELIEKNIDSNLDANYQKSQNKNMDAVRVDTMKGAWATYTMYSTDNELQPQTQLLVNQFDELVKALTILPDNFKLNPKLHRLIESRIKMAQGEILLDWGFAEALAFGSILAHKTNIRLSGQDSKRGTFSHRHSVFTDIENGLEYVPLNNISKEQGYFEVCNSPLSEFAVLGFEYGYSLADPDSLVIWEAQFGDFANGAQIIIDQFISSSEAKWYRMSGLVMLLPHGYEGQGPEHSSARLERFLQLCANNNLQVCNCSNASQYFHLLRRQALRKTRKPLIILTPKSLLRLESAGCNISEISQGRFREILYDNNDPFLSNAETIVFCSGKIFYDIEKEKKNKKRNDIIIIRIEQLYPFPNTAIQELLSQTKSAREYIWLQEEPINQGAWNYINLLLQNLLPSNKKIKCIARREASSPAAGLMKLHEQEQNQLLNEVLGVGLQDTGVIGTQVLSNRLT